MSERISHSEARTRALRIAEEAERQREERVKNDPDNAPCAECVELRAALAAATAPPEGEAEAILRRKEVRQPCSGKRGDGPWVLVEPAIYLSVTERDTVLAALAAATARADEDEAGRLRWEQEAERLRGERADLQHKLAHWQRVAEESGTMVARRVEAEREAIAATLADEAAFFRREAEEASKTRRFYCEGYARLLERHAAAIRRRGE